MKYRIWPVLVLLLVPTSLISGQQAGPDREHTLWIASVLGSIETVKPGMNRQDLLKVFNIEGGLSTRVHRIYVYKGCPYIKVTVDFQPVEHPEDWSTEMPSDKIIKISTPFLQYGIVD